jgi:hypothetical protein
MASLAPPQTPPKPKKAKKTVPTKTPDPKQLSDKHLEAAYKQYQDLHGVKVANPNLDSSRVILAGYLLFENYTSLKQFFQADPFINRFCKERYVSFRIPGVKHDFL